MKKLFFATLYILIFYNVAVQGQSDITQNRAWEIVKNDILKGNLQDINVFVSKSVISANSPIKTIYHDEKSPDFDAWFFFIDDNPFASWTHPCRYIFVNIKDGTYIILNKQLPPLFDQMDVLIERKLKTSGMLSDFSHLKRLKTTRTVAPAIHNYAVIISGGANAYNNWIRYWNDCSTIFSTLINTYGYPKDHVYVLISDGTDPGNDRHRYDGNYDSSPLDLDGDG